MFVCLCVLLRASKMEQAESSPKLEENTEQSETNIDRVSTAPFAIGKSDKENECTESLSPAVDPLLLETGPGGKNVLQLVVTQLCHGLLRRWHVLQPEMNHRVRSHLRGHLSPSTDNVVTIELSDEEDEVLQQSNTKGRLVDDAAETALGDTLQKDDGEPQSAFDLVIKEKNYVTLPLSANELDTAGRDVMQGNLSEDMTTDNVLEQEADDENTTRNGGEEMFTCAVKKKNIALEDELHERNIQNLVQQTISKGVMPIVNIPEQQPGDKDLNERVVNKNSKGIVHRDRKINVRTLHLSEDKLEAEVKSNKSKLLHENKPKISLFNDHIPEQKLREKNPRKRNLKLFNADHLIIKKRISSKIRKIRTERELVVRYENISTLRDHVEPRVERTRNDCVQLNHYYVRKSISVQSYKGFGDNSIKVSKNNNFNMTLNVYEDLDESYMLFSSPKQTVIGDYLIHEDDAGLGNNDNKGNARPEVDLIGDENTLSPESNILRELQEVDVSNVEAIIDLDSDEENATIKGISGDVNKNSGNRFIRTYSAFRRNTKQGDNETTNIGTYHNRENSPIVNVNNVIKTYEGYNRIRERKSCESKREISKQDSAVTDKNASSNSTGNDDTTILETGSENAKGCNKNHYSHNKKPRKRQQNELSIVHFLQDHNYVDMNRRSSCSSAGAGTDNAEAELAVDATDPLVTPQSSRSTTPDFSTPAPKSVKKRRVREMLLYEGRNGGRRLTKRVELPDIEEVRRHNRNMLTAQVTPITQCQGGLINTASCDHNKSPNTSSSAASLAGCSRCAALRSAPAAHGDGAGGRLGAPATPGDGGHGRLRRGAASRARSFITTISKKREYILTKVRRKPVIFGAKPYRRKRRRRRPRFTSPDNVSNDDENMPTRDLIILENQEAPTHSTDPVPQSETITSNSNDTPSILNKDLPTHNLATHHKEHDTILSSNSVAGFESVPSNGAFSTPNEGVPTLSLFTARKEQDIARSFDPLNSAQLLQSSNDAPAPLTEDYLTRQLTTVQKEQELTHSFDPVAGFKPVASNAAPSVLTKGILKQNFTTVQREQKTTRPSKVMTQFESSNALIECSTQNLSESRKEQKPPRSLKRVTFNIQSVPVLDEGVSMRELATTQSNQETNAYHRNSVPSNTVPSISNESLSTQGLTSVCYPNTRTYGFIAPSSSTAHDPSVQNQNVQTRDVITTLNNQVTASKRATRIESVPSTPSWIQNKLDTCKRVKLPLPTASLNERRNSVDILYASKSKTLTEKVKACEESEQQKQSSKSGFKPLLFRRGSSVKQAKPVCVSYLTNPAREIHDFTSDPKGPKEVTQQLPKIINVTSYTNEQVNIQSTNDRENCHNLAATLKRTIPSSEQVTSPMTAHLPKPIRESDSQSSQQIDRRVESLGPEPIQPRALSKITLKRAQPVYASYHSPNEMEVLISEPQEEGQEMHLPRVVDVTGDHHVIQPDDRMGLHLVVSQDEVCNVILSISQLNF